MKTNGLFSLSPARRILSLICVGGLVFVGLAQVFGQDSTERLRQEPLSLDVPVLRQSMGTSCGEAVIAMTYNYAYPDTSISEQEVIVYAKENGFFTEDLPPFTSPANMVKIANHYADDAATGSVFNSNQGLRLLTEKLRMGEPVIIDVLSNFSDPSSEAHFVVVTGLSVDPDREEAVIVHYNDPLTGTKEADEWLGSTGVWNAWQNNGDPGGAGWWLVIAPP